MKFIAGVEADQIIQLEGVQNFREVGGYPIRDGGRMKRGLVWRSARLNGLTDRDLETISELGIVTVVDLRRGDERRRYPTRPEFLMGATAISRDEMDREGRRKRQSFERANGSEEDYFKDLLSMYRSIAEKHGRHLRDLCDAVAAGCVPILIHCAAGKDRTGIAVALVLELVGVNRSSVLADYMKSEELIDWCALSAVDAQGVGADGSWIERLSPLARTLLLRSDQRYLAAALEDMESRAGSVEAFAIAHLGIGREVIDAMRRALVVSDPLPPASNRG